MHRTVEPAILYFGTPVVLVSSENEDASFNLAPMSSAWWLGWRCLLGFGARSKTPQNMMRTGECVLNLPSADMVERVDRLAKLTGSNPVPEHKVCMGYRHEHDKFGIAELTPIPSDTVTPPRVLECPVQMEAVVEATYPLAAHDNLAKGKLVAFEVRIKRVHVEESILMRGQSNRIDPEKWRPLIMSFQHFYGLSSRLYESTLAQIPEEAYRPAPIVTTR
ncbi:MAG TPA: flavin reductase family protein [Terriglobales bacterium]|nr:flavin reductase family protein [Terriglobales bacterium]